jgi:DNA-binding XRE family transcriptional regulator
MKLQELREGKSLTIEGLSEMARVPVKTITAIEGGETLPSQITGNKLAKALEVRPDQIEEVMAAVHGAWETNDEWSIYNKR